MKLNQLLSTWEEHATIKQWKKGLKINSKRNRLSKKTEEVIHTWMPVYIEFTQKSPNDLIEEALGGKHIVKERLSDFCTWLQDERKKKFNASVHMLIILFVVFTHTMISTLRRSELLR